ncbi:uncharacterized protein LOC134817454 [Bolinopsis microptera]|uniref:uncharacterized protein LOC134817454 n=1 Tax=Bolinopsis microptera TaxID=2820187 RepID=UPI00307A5BC9
MVICLLSLLLLLLLPLLSSSSSLKLTPILSEHALCNDHTQAKYYIDKKEPGSSKWIIYLESGGGCSTKERCKERYSSSTILMSSKWLDDYVEIDGLDILSSDDENPFSDYNHVYLPYCSSDMYVGMNEKPGSSFDKEDGNFVFAGYHIVQGLMADLKNIPEAQFEDIVLAGSSAGGIGVINHIRLTKGLFLPTFSDVRVRGVVDSSWFINFEDNFLLFWDSTSADELTGYKSFPNMVSDEDTRKQCSLEYGGMPCCFQADCMEHHMAFTDLELLFIQSKNDIYLLQSSLIRSLQSRSLQKKGFDAIALSHVADIASSYSGAMILSVNSTKNTKLSYYLTSCLQHVYLAPSSFWSKGQPLNQLDEKGFAEIYQALKDLDLETFPIKFNQLIRPKTMYSVKVGPPEYPEKTLSDVISEWAADSSEMIYVQDGCVGIDCNPTCPDKLEFVYTTNSWSDTANITVMSILGSITLVCLIMKLVMMVLLSWLQIQQRDYNLGVVATESFIPALGPSDMMSVSCVDLSHSITYVIDKDEGEGGTGFKKLENDVEGNGPLLGNGKVKLSNKPSKLSVISTHLNKKTSKKQILDKVSVYFNPSSFVGIMGPSGCGKTTFLDVVTGRREISSHQQAKILIDGQDFDGMKEEFTKMLAYVLQLERPYHEALTVRENLTFEALMRLPKDCPLSTVFNRVETVLQECGLDKIADAVVGGDAGGGISGGQKRKLCVALQLIDYPSIIFLDEPTSGLDSTSSYELMAMLSKLQVSKRCIVLTIHQPRQEIFHLFTHILLLVGGQVAFYGSPLKAYGVLETALKKNNVEIKDFVGDADIKNEADLLMDMLNNENAQKIMIDYYKETELENVKEIIAKTKLLQPFNKDTITSRKKMQQAGGFMRTVLALESRIMLQQTLFQILYLPLIFLFVPLVLGYVYYKAAQSILIISVYCVVTCMGPLFMTSIIMNLINDTLRVFLMQYKDGIGCLYHVVFMVLRIVKRCF